MTFEEYATKHGLKLEASAIPFRSGPGSDSFEAGDKPEHARPLHFAVTLRNAHGAPIWRGEYSVGAAWPIMWAQKAAKTRHGSRLLSALGFDGRRRLPRLPVSPWGSESLMDFETRQAVRRIYRERAPLEAGDVLQSLAMDWQSVDSDYCDGFEDWAESLGYDTDSRKAESIFNHCRETARTARRTLGADAFRELLDCEE